MVEPAWKRLGLKVKAVVSHDPLAIVTERQDVGDSKTVGKKSQGEKKEAKVNKTKRKAESTLEKGDDGKKGLEKKRAKRVKVPKAERKPTNVVKDQLQYMIDFSNNREKWKFSKQKQNWIIKNIRNIPEEYEEQLFKYLESVQGGSRDRIASEMKVVVEEWNTMVQDAEKQMEKDLEKGEKGAVVQEEEEEAEDEDGRGGDDGERKTKESKKSKKSKDTKETKESSKTPVDYDYAIRARTIVKLLSGEDLVMSGVVEDKEPVVNFVEESVNI